MLLLIDDRPDRPDEEPPPPRRRLPHPPWRPFAWLALFLWLLYLAEVVNGLAGYGILLLALTIGCWRLDRWLARQYWGGLRETQRF